MIVAQIQLGIYSLSLSLSLLLLVPDSYLLFHAIMDEKLKYYEQKSQILCIKQSNIIDK